MTPEQFLDALSRLGLSKAEAARQLGVARSTVSRWAEGARTIPGPVVELIRTWLSYQDAMTKVREDNPWARK